MTQKKKGNTVRQQTGGVKTKVGFWDFKTLRKGFLPRCLLSHCKFLSLATHAFLTAFCDFFSSFFFASELGTRVLG